MAVFIPKSVHFIQAAVNNIVLIISVIISIIGILFLDWDGKEVVSLFVTNLIILLFSGAIKIFISHGNKDFADWFFFRLFILVFYLIFGAVLVSGIGDYILPQIEIKDAEGLFSHQNQVYILLLTHLIDLIYWVREKKHKTSFAWTQAVYHVVYFIMLYKILAFFLRFVNNHFSDSDEIQRAALLILFVRIAFEIVVNLLKKLFLNKFHKII